MKYFYLIFIFSCFQTFSQIQVDKNFPYNDPSYLVDNILLGGGVVASNYSFEGDTMQIGFFNALNTHLGLDSGIVLSTGDVSNLVPGNVSFNNPANLVTDPDLLNVANSVPGLIGQSFTVSGINDVAKLEFDFIPNSDTITFRYVFGSQEYFGWENTQYNDVFGFFLSGPGIAGPYANGSINLATVPGSNPPLPITVSSINSVTPINQQYFVDNTTFLDTIADANGITTVLTATAVVQCGELYHIRLAIADGSDQGLSSYVWLEAGSFKSPILDVTNDLGYDSSFIQIPCNSSIMLIANGGLGASYQWIDQLGNIISVDSFVVVGPGKYIVSAISSGCSVQSDTITIDGDTPPSFDLGPDTVIPCNTTIDLNPVVTGGTGVYIYEWSDGSSNSSLNNIGSGQYKLTIDDGTGCVSEDSIIITEETPPILSVSGGGSICNDGTTIDINFIYNGLMPWDLIYTDGSNNYEINQINSSTYTIYTSDSGSYYPISVKDLNNCFAIYNDTILVNVNDLPMPEIEPNNITFYEGESVYLSLLDNYQTYQWYNEQDSLLSSFSSILVDKPGKYYVIVVDDYNCIGISDIAFVNSVPFTKLFIPSSFTPNGDEHNDLFHIYGLNLKSFFIKIVNRWGDIVYESYDINKFWDGKYDGRYVQEGSYFYVIEVIGRDNQPFTRLGEVKVIY